MADLANPAEGERIHRALHALVEEADRSLHGIDPLPFSTNAFTRLKEKIAEYTAQLITESIKISKRHKADTVSTSHVEHASQYLVSSTSHKLFKHLGTIGGILLGTGASNILSMVTTNQYGTTGIISSFILTAIGAFMVAAHIARD